MFFFLGAGLVDSINAVVRAFNDLYCLPASPLGSTDGVKLKRNVTLSLLESRFLSSYFTDHDLQRILHDAGC